jgi:hypothetical protein
MAFIVHDKGEWECERGDWGEGVWRLTFTIREMRDVVFWLELFDHLADYFFCTGGGRVYGYQSEGGLPGTHCLVSDLSFEMSRVLRWSVKHISIAALLKI